MDQFATALIEWIGKVFLQKLAGTVVSAAWKKVSLRLEETLRLEPQRKLLDVEQQRAVQNFETAYVQAAHLLVQAQLRIAELEAENAALRARLAKYEGEPP